MRVRAGMRTRVAGRHHQQSTDDDDGVSFHSATLMWLVLNKTTNKADSLREINLCILS